MNYVGLATKQYGEGRICLVSDRISGENTKHGVNSISFWRKLLEWTSQKKAKEIINICLIDNSYYKPKLYLNELYQSQVSTKTYLDIVAQGLNKYDIVYISGLTSYVSEEVKQEIEKYVNSGGGLLIENPNIEGVINILELIDSINVSSINPPNQTFAYWTIDGKSHYSYYSKVKINFYSQMLDSEFDSSWIILMSSIETEEESTIGSEIESDKSLGAEFGISFISSMQKGLVILGEEVFIESSSSSSIDSSSSSSSSGVYDWNFCENIIAYWKMNDNNDSPVLFDETGSLYHIAKLYDGTNTTKTLNKSISGRVNRAISFNGATNYAKTFQNASLNISDDIEDKPLSISLWAYPVQNKEAFLLYKKGAWGLYLKDKKIFFRLYNGASYAEFYTDAIMEINRWNNITIAYNPNLQMVVGEVSVGSTRIGPIPSQFCYIYLNGTRYTTYHSNVGAYTYSSNNLSYFFIGNKENSLYFNGLLDNIFIVDKVLNGIEVEMLYNENNGTEDCLGLKLFNSSSSSSSSSIDSSSSSSSLEYSSSSSSSSLEYSSSSSSSSLEYSSSSSSVEYSSSSSSVGYSSSSSSLGYSSSSSSSLDINIRAGLVDIGWENIDASPDYDYDDHYQTVSDINGTKLIKLQPESVDLIGLETYRIIALGATTIRVVSSYGDNITTDDFYIYKNGILEDSFSLGPGSPNVTTDISVVRNDEIQLRLVSSVGGVDIYQYELESDFRVRAKVTNIE